MACLLERVRTVLADRPLHGSPRTAFRALLGAGDGCSVLPGPAANAWSSQYLREVRASAGEEPSGQAQNPMKKQR